MMRDVVLYRKVWRVGFPLFVFYVGLSLYQVFSLLRGFAARNLGIHCDRLSGKFWPESCLGSAKWIWGRWLITLAGGQAWPE